MRCERCQGSDHVVIVRATETGEWMQTELIAQPCPECNGSGVAHCCEGERPQPEREKSKQ
jgi:DnaJ-class molecular chaperone